MYEIPQGWEAYYEELEMEERKEIFERLLQELPDDGLNAFRKEIHQKRYPEPAKKNRPQIDQFLLSIVYFPVMYGKKPSIFNNVEKEINKTCKDLGIDLIDSLSEEKKSVLYLEYLNAAALYFSTCKDGSYGRKLFGMMQSDDKEKAALACQDAWILSIGIPRMADKEKEMQLFSEAIKQAYFRFDKKAETRFRELEETMKQRLSGAKKGWLK